MIERLAVVLSEDAVEDLQSIAAFVFRRSGSERLAEAFIDRIEARCQKIGNAPRAGRARDDLRPKLRTVPFVHSAVICYLVEEDRVLVTNIFGRGRDFEAILRGEHPEATDD